MVTLRNEISNKISINQKFTSDEIFIIYEKINKSL